MRALTLALLSEWARLTLLCSLPGIVFHPGHGPSKERTWRLGPKRAMLVPIPIRFCSGSASKRERPRPCPERSWTYSCNRTDRWQSSCRRRRSPHCSGCDRLALVERLQGLRIADRWAQRAHVRGIITTPSSPAQIHSSVTGEFGSSAFRSSSASVSDATAANRGTLPAPAGTRNTAPFPRPH